MITENVKRFIELQIQVNNQIDSTGQADPSLADELDALGDQLTNEEISVMITTLMEDDMLGIIEYEDAEWLVD